jgi:beta-glucosidase/6-phospho-beta-glucosidase/beta-galactosidase
MRSIRASIIRAADGAVETTANVVTARAFSDLVKSLLEYDTMILGPGLYLWEGSELVNGVVDDAQRLAYIRDHIAATYDAMAQGVPVGAYFAWSLMDNFEWASGYAKRFGLVHVDFETQKRTLKNSALWYRNFLSKA